VAVEGIGRGRQRLAGIQDSKTPLARRPYPDFQVAGLAVKDPCAKVEQDCKEAIADATSLWLTVGPTWPSPPAVV
jgi:hypothetical protein